MVIELTIDHIGVVVDLGLGEHNGLFILGQIQGIYLVGDAVGSLGGGDHIVHIHQHIAVGPVADGILDIVKQDFHALFAAAVAAIGGVELVGCAVVGDSVGIPGQRQKTCLPFYRVYIQQHHGVRPVAADIRAAEQNAAKLGVKIAFRESDLLEKVQGEYDLIVANLPYVDKKWDWLSPELTFEPDQALYAEDAGLYDIKRLISQAEQHLTKNGAIILESDLSQHDAIQKYLEQNTNLTFVKAEGLAQLFAK